MDAAVRFPTSPKAVKAAPITLRKRMSVEQAFQAILRNCIEQIHANEAGVVRGQDTEFLHQMRIGLRRLDAAFKLFADLLRAPPGMAGELAWLMDQLGPARDWDVLTESTLLRVADGLPGQAALDGVTALAGEKSAALHAQAGAAVSSPRFATLLAAMENWIAQRGWRDDLPAKGTARLDTRVPDFSGAVLERQQRRLRKRARQLGDADPGRLHRLRIAAKRARYATEFFASLYAERGVRRHVRQLARLQDELGWLNDAAVASRLLAELAAEHEAVREEAALARGYLAASAVAGAAPVRASWKKCAKGKLHG